MALDISLSTNTKLSAAASTNATLVKATAGTLFELSGHNTAAYAVFVKFYDKATAPTVGTDVPILTVGFPAGVTTLWSPNFPLQFRTGIAMAITKLATDADTTVLVAGDILLTTVTA